MLLFALSPHLFAFHTPSEVEEIEKVLKELEQQKRASVDATRTLKRAALTLKEEIATKVNSLNIDNG